jgi:hypothetical protein
MEAWRKCSSCKKSIGFGQDYWVCNVSTCNRKRTGLAFCRVSCWDAHLPLMNHRESWAEERKAPTAADWERIQKEEAEPKTRKPRAVPAPAESAPLKSTGPARVILRRGTATEE